MTAPSNPTVSSLLREALAQLFECVGVRPGLIRHVAANVEQALALLEADPWIAVDYDKSETLPGNIEVVLLTNGRTINLGYRDDRRFWFYGAAGLQETGGGAITHWMRLRHGPQATGAGR